MPEDHLRELIDGIRTRLLAELDSQLEALKARHERAIERARREADAEAEQRWASKIDLVRGEWTARLESEVTAARNDAEKRLVAESMRVRVEAEQAAAETAAAQRRELEEAISAERQRADARVEAERRRAEQELEQTLAALAAERRQTEPQPTGAGLPANAQAILDAARSIEATASLSDGLTALARGASAQGARCTVFVVNGNRLDEWTADGVAGLSAGSLRTDAPESGLLREAVLGRRPVLAAPGGAALKHPALAGLPPGGSALAVPVIVGGQTVAVLYGDNASHGTPPDRWQTALELLGQLASACLARLTATRALELLQSGNGAALAANAAPPVSDDDQSARRYARLLVSEIKLYNEAAVRLGREKRDLLERLKPEIERARRLYEERVSASVTARGFYFHQELVQTLAGGDPALLGA